MIQNIECILKSRVSNCLPILSKYTLSIFINIVSDFTPFNHKSKKLFYSYKYNKKNIQPI